MLSKTEISAVLGLLRELKCSFQRSNMPCFSVIRDPVLLLMGLRPEFFLCATSLMALKKPLELRLSARSSISFACSNHHWFFIRRSSRWHLFLACWYFERVWGVLSLKRSQKVTCFSSSRVWMATSFSLNKSQCRLFWIPRVSLAVA